MILGQEPLGFRRVGFSPTLSLLMSAFSLPAAPPPLASRLHRRWNAPLPLLRVYGFGGVLEPRYIYGANNLDQ
jgi:hypothetical protein